MEVDQRKNGSRSKIGNRILHGKEDWAVRYQEGNKLFGYKITVIRDKIVDVQVSEQEELDPALGCGVDVHVTELDATHRSLDRPYAVQTLSEIFGIYLSDYTDVEIFFAGERLDSSKLIASRRQFELSPIVDREKHIR